MTSLITLAPGLSLQYGLPRVSTANAGSTARAWLSIDDLVASSACDIGEKLLHNAGVPFQD